MFPECRNSTTINSFDSCSSRASSLSQQQSCQTISTRLPSEMKTLISEVRAQHQASKMKSSTQMALCGQNVKQDHLQNMSIQCLRFKYFSISIIFVVCLVLLAASLVTNKWLVARPIRSLRIMSGGSAQSDANITSPTELRSLQASLVNGRQPLAVGDENGSSRSFISSLFELSEETDERSTKFQGRIQFGLFSGTKVLNHGFGERISQISVAQSFFSGDDGKPQIARPHEIISFRCWLLTLNGVVLAMLFALVGSISAIINFVIVPRGIVGGQIGLVCFNSAACVCLLVSTTSWLYEYFAKLKSTVLTPEETQNGWISKDRSQLGYSFYLVVAALMLHLVNISMVLVVHSKSWTDVCRNTKENIERQSSSTCEGVTMLY